MIVEVRALLLAFARDRVRFAAEMVSTDLPDVEEPLRARWLVNRGRLAAGLLVEALDLLRLAETKQ